MVNVAEVADTPPDKMLGLSQNPCEQAEIGIQLGAAKQPEYAEFRRLARQLARWAGDPDPGFPDTDTIKQLFGNWQAVVQAARQHSDPDADDQDG